MESLEFVYRYKTDTQRYHKYEMDQAKTADYIMPPIYLSRKMKSAPKEIKITVAAASAPRTKLRKFVAEG